jgi:steroid 5-alpha reductase family enzyme
MQSRTSGRLWIAVAYLTGAAAGLLVGKWAGSWLQITHPLWIAALADGVATLVVFGFSRALDNSSLYDPYWSVAPPLLGLYWALAAGPGTAWRRLAVLALVGVWAARLTWNCLRRWDGLKDEDWRYRRYRARFPRGYWWISLAGLHGMPTVVVYLGCLPLYAALAAGARPLNWVDGAALLVTAGAIWLEAAADRALWRFRQSNPSPGSTLRSGLWRLARHPNYLGEMAFWWGLYLFALAADPGAWWTVAGPLSVTALFTTVSIPMMERHLRARRTPSSDA